MSALIGHPVLTAIIQGGALVLLGIILLMIPRAMALFRGITRDVRRIASMFARQLGLEREAHRQENADKDKSIDGLTEATNRQTRELQKQTLIMERIERVQDRTERVLDKLEGKISGDLPVLEPGPELDPMHAERTERIDRPKKG